MSLNYFLESKARSPASYSRSTCSSDWSHHEFSRAALQQTKGFLCLVSGAKKRTSLENPIYVLHMVCTRNMSWWVAANLIMDSVYQGRPWIGTTEKLLNSSYKVFLIFSAAQHDEFHRQIQCRVCSMITPARTWQDDA